VTVADRDALVRLLGAVPEDHPLTAVVHAAGALDDDVLLSATPERFDRVAGDAARNQRLTPLRDDRVATPSTVRENR
jgi:hypothetical protein